MKKIGKNIYLTEALKGFLRGRAFISYNIYCTYYYLFNYTWYTNGQISHFSRKFKYSPKIQFLSRNIVQKFKGGANIVFLKTEILVKNRSRKIDFDQYLKFWTKIENLVRDESGLKSIPYCI